MVETWRLGHRPALDGLRGVAVMLVVVGHVARHGAVNWLSGSGVAMFFVLSGFLITSLLLEELDRTGRLSLSRFYGRRARRLAPALVAMVAVVAVAGLVVPRYPNWPMLLGTVTWSANWVKITQLHHGLNAGPVFGTPLGHTWSLAVEEQFYLLWPLALLVLLRFGRRTTWTVTAVAVAVTPSLAYLDHDPYRDYYSSETRAMPLLVGGLLAMWMHGRAERRAGGGGTVAAVALVLTVLVTGIPSWYPTVSAQLVALLSALAIWGVAQGRHRSFLHAGWLRVAGQRSYGLYLWHWPVYVLIWHTTDGATWILVLIGIPTACLLALLSWYYVERPFLRPARKIVVRPGEPRREAQVAASVEVAS